MNGLISYNLSIHIRHNIRHHLAQETAQLKSNVHSHPSLGDVLASKATLARDLQVVMVQ